MLILLFTLKALNITRIQSKYPDYFEPESALPDLSNLRKLGSLPTNYDFTTAYPNCNPSVKDQGYCGSCYSFAASSAMELRKCKQTNTYVALSPQEINSCSEYNEGCGGGYDKLSFLFSEKYGLRTQSCSPYLDYSTSAYKSSTSACPETCTGTGSNSNKYFCKKGSTMSVPLTDEVKNEIYNRGPVYLGIKVYGDFSYVATHTVPYKADTYNWSFRGWHAITLIGWGTTSLGVNYWLILNSWGSSWGNSGKAMIDKTDTNTLPTNYNLVTFCIME